MEFTLTPIRNGNFGPKNLVEVVARRSIERLEQCRLKVNEISDDQLLSNIYLEILEYERENNVLATSNKFRENIRKEVLTVIRERANLE